jgi:hypothetical protein
VGLLNLFLYILKCPSAPTAPSDIALMDTVAGHFGRVEFLTGSEFSFPFIREITNLANLMVKRARGKMNTGERSEQRNRAPGIGATIGVGMGLERGGRLDRMEGIATQSSRPVMGGGLMDEPISAFGLGNENDVSSDLEDFDSLFM